MDVILKNTMLSRCEHPPHSCFYAGEVGSSRILNFLKVKTGVMITKLTGNRLHLPLYTVALNYFRLKQILSVIERNRK